MQRTDSKENFLNQKNVSVPSLFLVTLLRKGLLLYSELTHASDKKFKGACEDII